MGRLTIGIAGAGVGGLASASLLADLGHDVTVFDQFDAPRPVGSGLIVQPVGLAVLDRIGAGLAARNLGARIARLRGVECETGRTALDVSYGTAPDRQGLAIHRASLFAVLLAGSEARGIALESGRRIAGPTAPASASAPAGPRQPSTC